MVVCIAHKSGASSGGVYGCLDNSIIPRRGGFVYVILPTGLCRFQGRKSAMHRRKSYGSGQEKIRPLLLKYQDKERPTTASGGRGPRALSDLKNVCTNVLTNVQTCDII